MRGRGRGLGSEKGLGKGAEKSLERKGLEWRVGKP